MTDLPPESNTPDVANALGKVLSAHGYGFQYAVMRAAEKLFDDHRSKWLFEAAEFPVQVGDTVTHVDFACRTKSGHTYLVAECKRADPARAHWCFVRTPYTRMNGSSIELVFEDVIYDPGLTRAAAHFTVTGNGVFQLGVELNTRAKGDGLSGRSSINEAAAQVLRATNGMVNHLHDVRRMQSKPTRRLRFLPVVFTTAELWVSDTDLSEADLRTGIVRVVAAKSVDWLWFNYNQSPALQHRIERAEFSADLSASLRDEFTRSIAIVAPEGIGPFLSATFEEWAD